MHKFHFGNLPENVNCAFTPVNILHCPSASKGV